MLTQCKREQQLQKTTSTATDKLANLQAWWRNLKTPFSPYSDNLSRIPDTTTITNYWRGQFQNGVPKWSNAVTHTLNGETIHEVPFQFPDNLVLMDDKPDSPVQPYLSGKTTSGASGKVSEAYLVVKERPGRDYVAEIMIVALHNSLIKQLDSVGSLYPTLHLANVYPAVGNTGEFTGSVKFYDLSGVQILQQGYNGGALVEYIAFGNTAPNFPITPTPNLPTTRSYQICSYTYVYQQNCAPDAGCTDWELIAVMFNGCQTIVVPDSPPVPYPGITPTIGGGGFTNPPPPNIEQNPPIPNADLCGKYSWKKVGDSHTAQIRNMGAIFNYTSSNGGSSNQTIVMGWICVTYPSWVVHQGYDLNKFVNKAFNEAKWTVLFELSHNLLPGSSAAILPRFKQLMTRYISETGDVYIGGASISYHNGCFGDIPVSQPKWCAPN